MSIEKYTYTAVLDSPVGNVEGNQNLSGHSMLCPHDSSLVLQAMRKRHLQ